MNNNIKKLLFFFVAITLLLQSTSCIHREQQHPHTRVHGQWDMNAE